MDNLDVALLDDELHAEIQMVTELMEAANQSAGRLNPQLIDALLGFGQPTYVPSQVASQSSQVPTAV